mgnify:CR=1 FL=1
MVKQTLSKKRKSFEVLMKSLMYASLLVTVSLVLFLIIYVLMQGLPHISWNFLTTKPSYLTENIGILPDILNTLYIDLTVFC